MNKKIIFGSIIFAVIIIVIVFSTVKFSMKMKQGSDGLNKKLNNIKINKVDETL